MVIKSIQTGTTRTMTYREHEMRTGIFKNSDHGQVFVGTLNIEGDHIEDLRVHGGKDKAVYAYACDAYNAWKEIRPGESFPPGAMGENFTVEGLAEDKIYIGDTFEVGEVIVQVTQPRFPCQKLAAKFNDPHIIRQFMKLERPGIYFRVLKEGTVNIGDSFKLISREEIHVSVVELFILNSKIGMEITRLREILNLKTLNEHWRREIRSMIES